ncbi:hypothetical protein BGZ83_011675 [Gryganskiella cystojenkinii]|nr:hypothetical protein BGZ83_011675 [Gryganskiella cystojenkinii]
MVYCYYSCGFNYLHLIWIGVLIILSIIGCVIRARRNAARLEAANSSVAVVMQPVGPPVTHTTGVQDPKFQQQPVYPQAYPQQQPVYPPQQPVYPQSGPYSPSPNPAYASPAPYNAAAPGPYAPATSYAQPHQQPYQF